MMDISQRTLSDAIVTLGEEINRGCWVLDRLKGVPVEMVQEVVVTAVVTAHPDRLVLESISVSNTGGSTQVQDASQNQQGSQSQSTSQTGQNTNVTTNDYKEA